jgi:UMF1 family MFS transporter
VLLESLARANGTFFSDSSKPCLQASGSVRIRAEKESSEQCMIEVLGRRVSTSSFAMYTFSAAVMVQAITLLCTSSFADYGTFSISYFTYSSHGAI